MTRDRVYALIDTERARQEELKARGKFTATCADNIDNFRKLAVLLEEVGEAAMEVNDGHLECLKIELVQVAAVTVAWLESFSERVKP